MATPTDDDNADDCISGNYYGYERGGTLASNIPSTVHKKRVTLEFSKWDDSTGQQSIEDENIKEDSVILISLPLNTTDDAAYEFSSADITACEQVEGKITLKYTGEKPKRNFLIDLCIIYSSLCVFLLTFNIYSSNPLKHL